MATLLPAFVAPGPLLSQHARTVQLGGGGLWPLASDSRRPRVRTATAAPTRCPARVLTALANVPRTEQVEKGSGDTTLYAADRRSARMGGQELCVLVGVDVTSRSNAGKRLFGIRDSIEELSRLAETAGMDVVGVVTQALTSPYPGTYIGTGKVDEVRREMEAAGCKTCIFDEELSPAQQRTLENAFGGEAKGIKVLDRTALILDIFAQHAASREGQLQVELALYQYRLPRLTRMWTHLERQSGAGGVGLRGPGETQLESDRRMINTRIVKLRKDIDSVRQHRSRQRSARRKNAGLPVVALVGYTNAGKSTVLNALTGAHVLQADALFATLDPTTRRAQLEGLKLSPEILITDTVGFVQNLPTQLVAAFRATLEEVAEADVLVHVVDASLNWELMALQIQAVENVLKQINADGKPTVVALNKIDKLQHARTVDDGKDADFEEGLVTLDDQSDGVTLLPAETLESLLSQVHEMTGYEAVGISARSGEGIDEVGVLLEEVLRDVLVPIEAIVPYSRGELVAAVHEQGVCDYENFLPEGTHIIARAPHGLVARLRDYAVDELSDDAPSEDFDSEEIDWVSLAKKRS
jgi:GTPase